MKNLSFSDGLEEYSLNDRVTVRFNPTDASFIERLAALFEKLDALQEEVASAQETTPEEEVFPLARSLDARMRNLLDEFFGVPVCEPLFGAMNLFAHTGELTAREARIAKYTEKYRK